MRKLISIATLLIYTSVNAQNFQQYQFQPQYQSQSGEYASEGSLYLPPETQTTLPYFPLKGSNNLPYQYLPPTGTKAPSVYPSPFPIMVSSIVPNFDDDDDDDDDSNDNSIRISSPKPQNNFKLRPNTTQNNGVRHPSDKREMRSLPKTVSYNHPIDRIDIKFPLKMTPTQPPQMFNAQNPSNRRMIMENIKSEPLTGDQVKTASYHGVQYVQPPPGYLAPTTEPAIPILRLSNEMDLDGSYSYEALGADQTHYVQHSRMENMGTDKEEQVVEGSYSYVGDNGQTYTVNYVADANGFRASGDHLPVGPPVPEIIQRSIQYNLAEEAKRPPHLQGWHDEERTNEIDARDRIQRFPASPSRGLFTGRTPEAFSYNFAKTSNSQNNIVPAPSSPAPVIAHLDQPKDQPPQQGNAPISPQITFLASQGAHVPSINTIPMPQPQNIARVFNTNNEKSMPKLMNYEFTTNENENENNKALWRWQYGLNANAAKHLISRSSGYNEDEVSMTFSEMSPEQYKFMIHSQFGSSGSNDNTDRYDSPVSSAPIITSTEHDNNLPINHKNIEPVDYQISTMRSIIEKHRLDEKKHVPITPYISNWQDRSNDENVQSQIIHKNIPSYEHNNYQNKAPKLITQNDFLPPSQMVTQSYDYDESFYEPRKIKSSRNNNLQNNNESENNIERPAPKNDQQTFSVFTEPNKDTVEEIISSTVPIEYTTSIPIKPKEWIPLRPVIENEEYFSEQNESPSTTTEKPMNEILKTNIFLKNAFRPKQEHNIIEKEFVKKEFNEQNNHQSYSDPDKTKIDEKNPKSLQSYQKPHDELKYIRKRPLDMSEVLNYYASKNQFESSKIRPKFQKNINFVNKPDIPINFPHSKLGEGNYFNNNNNDNRNDLKENQLQEKPNLVVKKYKTLQRNNIFIGDQGNKEIRRDLIPPPPQNYNNIPNLPPLGRAGPTVKSYLPPIFV